jgi:glycosyltransferase involved in cell wall biosynthesis
VIALEAPGVGDVLSGAAELVSSVDDGELAAAIKKVATDESERDQLAQAGRRMAMSLTWERAAARFREVVEQLAR